MTEAMSRREIEDVLTSIKRLVSQDIPTRHAEPERAPQPEKLVLTEELRVADAPEPAPEPPTGEATVDMQASDIAMSSDMADTAAPGATDPVSEIAVPARENATNVPTQPLSGAQPVMTMLKDSAGPVAPSLIRRIANAGGAPTLGAPNMLDSTTPMPDPAAETPPETTRETTRETAEDLPQQVFDQISDPLEDAALEQTLARLEAVLSGKPAPSPEAAGAQPAPPPHAEAADPLAENAPSEQVIDENMLYQLVAQIVRQELQGELGEKITRNIRKLVRQEVARELQLRKS